MPGPDHKAEFIDFLPDFLRARPMSEEEKRHCEHRAHLQRIEDKVDQLHAALVQQKSSIILVGDDIARIAAELRRSKA